MNPLTQDELKTLRCDRCGGYLREGYEARDHGTDPATGAHDVELLCGACVDDEFYSRNASFCSRCGHRITGAGSGLCLDCIEDAMLFHSDGPDLLEIAKNATEDQDCG